MKKYVFSGILGISIITVVSLTFLAGSTKPVQYSWKAVILDTSPSLPSTNLTGGPGGVYDNQYPGWVYNDSDADVNVMAFIREYRSRGNESTYTPVFWLEILGESQIGLQYIDIGDDDYGSADGLNSCGFTGVEGAMLPSCWNLFLNGSHPKAGYQRASFMHDGERFMTKDEADFTKMQDGERETRVMKFNLVIQGQEIMGSCDQCNPTNYHQVDGDALGYWKSAIGNYDIYLTRIGENTWKVVVNTDFDNPNRQDEWPDKFSWGADKIWESYCECVKENVGKRTVLTKNIRQSSWIRAHIGYEILFIRTPK